MTGRVAKRIVLGGLVIGSLALPSVAVAQLPHPKTTLIVPGVSIAGVKLDMSSDQVFTLWGDASCEIPEVCTWVGPGSAGHAERAVVSFFSGRVIQIDIYAATGTNRRFVPGQLSKWRTSKNIGLGSTKPSVKRAYPAARANNSRGVNGYDLFARAGASLRYTRFASFGTGATPNLLRYIELACSSGSRC